MTGDMAHAAFYYRQCKSETVNDRLAACYLKLGCEKMAADLLATMKTDSTPTCGAIRLWGTMGQGPKAADLAEATAKDGNKEQAYLAAGDALRTAGDLDKAVEYYTKLTALPPKDEMVKALAQANLDALKLLQALDIAKLADGKYTGTVTAGHKGGVTIELALHGGKIGTARITENKEDAPLNAPLEMAQRIVQRQGFRGVDAVTGATSSSSAIVDAAITALAKGPATATPTPTPTPTATPTPTPKPTPAEDPNAKYKDGVYAGTGRGHKSDIEVKITVKGGKITDLVVTKQADDKAWWNRAIAVIPEIVKANGTEGVKPVTKATRSSNGIFRATDDALGKAKK